MVKRLGFAIPEFIRTIWVSEVAKDAWRSRISMVSNTYSELEIIATRAGLKPVTLQSVHPDRLCDLVVNARGYELDVIPLGQQASNQTYSNSASPYDPLLPWEYRVAIGRRDDVQEFAHCWLGKDDRGMGELLGFPTCCQQFFDHYWNAEGYRDLTYPMVIDPNNLDQTKFEVSCAPSNNILLRWLGIRRVSHLPCSFRCEATRTIGDEMQQMMAKSFPRESAWLDEMLKWPVQWSSLHGVAIITTPVVRVVTSTDAFGEQLVVNKIGTSYPAEGASGIDFPFQHSFPVKLMRKDPNYWRDNGFGDESAMNKAHKGVLRAASFCEVPAVKRILDLGAGNGVLLEKIGSMFQADLVGIEKDRDRWERGATRGAERGYNILLGDLYETDLWNPPYGLTLISINRLFEVPIVTAQDLLERMARGSCYVLLYSYDGKELDFSWSDHYRMVYTHNQDPATAGSPVVYLLRSLYSDSSGSCG